jgi:hypothetical protein
LRVSARYSAGAFVTFVADEVAAGIELRHEPAGRPARKVPNV